MPTKLASDRFLPTSIGCAYLFTRCSVATNQWILLLNDKFYGNPVRIGPWGETGPGEKRFVISVSRIPIAHDQRGPVMDNDQEDEGFEILSASGMRWVRSSEQ